MPNFTFTGRGTRTTVEPFTFSIEVNAWDQADADIRARRTFAAGNYEEIDTSDSTDDESIVAFDTITVPLSAAARVAPAPVAPAPARPAYQPARSGTFVAPAPTPAPAPAYNGYGRVAAQATGTQGVAVAHVETRTNGYRPCRVRHQ